MGRAAFPKTPVAPRTGAMLNTAFLLAAQYDGRVVIPLDEVRRDYFGHMTFDLFVRKVASGDIPLPILRTDSSQKAAKGVHLSDLALYLDECRKAGIKLRDQMAK